MEQEKVKRRFGLTQWAVKNKNTVYILIIALLIFGVYSYIAVPRELFPEVNYPTIFVQTIYPGNSAKDIENLVTDPLEKELKGVSNIKDIKSISAQDMSIVLVEFPANEDLDSRLEDVKDAVERAKANLPNDLPSDPQVTKFNFSQFPIVFVNISGKNYTLEELKHYAEYLKDEIEKIPDISKVEIKGLPDKEVQVNVDLNKLKQLNLSFNEIINAIKAENITASAGLLKSNGYMKEVRIVGQFKDIDQIRNIAVRSVGGRVVFLKDVADVKETYKDPESKARLFGNPVLSLQVIKKDKGNQVRATEAVKKILKQERKDGQIPADLKIVLTNDMSKAIKRQINSLGNNLLEGVIFVVLILLLFLGLRNSVIVGFAIPMSLVISFVFIALIGYTLNNIVLFSLILALGMLVDNGIVVTENIYRFVDRGVPNKIAVVDATSEIAVPIITSTLTTLSAFLPFAFWNSLVGEFMKQLPITLIIVLSASLFTALVLLPPIAKFMVKPTSQQHGPDIKRNLIVSGIFLLTGGFLYLVKAHVLANIMILTALLIVLYIFVLYPWAKWTQDRFLPWLERVYHDFIKFSLRGKNPVLIFIGTSLFLVISFALYFSTNPKITMFPNPDPRYINVYAYLAPGADLDKTDSVMHLVEKDVNRLMAPYRDIVNSVMVTVGKGVARDREIAIGKTLNRGRMTIEFVDYDKRHGISTTMIKKMLADSLIGHYPGVDVFIDAEKHGATSGKPISIEITGPDIQTLFQYGDSIVNRIVSNNIRGYDKLEFDMHSGINELIINVDRKKAAQYGLSTAMITQTIRTALFGTEASKYKEGKDEYPINVRLADKYRHNIDNLLNMKIPVRTPLGQVTAIPISTVASIHLSSTVDAIRHDDTKRALTIQSDVLTGYNANQINKQIKAAIASLQLPDGYSIQFTGEQKDMKESMHFMMIALLVAIILILTIMVYQFNSLVKPLIILFGVLFSTIGVFLGYALLGMDMSVLMSGIGIIALAGVVVNNGIVLIDYIDLLKRRRRAELGLEEDAPLPKEDIRQAIIEAGKTRLRPVLLTATTTILGVLPMAVGLNIDFGGLFRNLRPDIYFGGESMQFWAPLAWAIIWGLTFATFMTLVVVPSMYWMANRAKLKAQKADK